jgi:MFS family permease
LALADTNRGFGRKRTFARLRPAAIHSSNDEEIDSGLVSARVAFCEPAVGRSRFDALFRVAAMTGDAARSVGARVVFCLCAAEVLTMIGVFSFPALLPGFIAEWGLSNTEAGWISGSIFAGYTLAVPILGALTDRIDAKRVYLAGTLFAAVSALGFTLTADGFWTAIACRTLGGVGLAGTYMPGLKALVDRTSGARQARWISFYTASFSLGTSGSFLVTGAIAGAFGWRAAFGLAAAAALAALLLAAFGLPPVKPIPPKQESHPFDFSAVLRNRAVMGYVLGYSTHTWELFGARSWMVAYLAWAQASQPGAGGPSPTGVATIGALIAMVSSVVGADMAARMGRRRLCVFA